MNLSRRSIKVSRNIEKNHFFEKHSTKIRLYRTAKETWVTCGKMCTSDNTSIIQRDDTITYVSDIVRPNNAKKKNAKYANE